MWGAPRAPAGGQLALIATRKATRILVRTPVHVQSIHGCMFAHTPAHTHVQSQTAAHRRSDVTTMSTHACMHPLVFCRTCSGNRCASQFRRQRLCCWRLRRRLPELEACSQARPPRSETTQVYQPCLCHPYITHRRMPLVPRHCRRTAHTQTGLCPDLHRHLRPRATRHRGIPASATSMHHTISPSRTVRITYVRYKQRSQVTTHACGYGHDTHALHACLQHQRHS